MGTLRSPAVLLVLAAVLVAATARSAPAIEAGTAAPSFRLPTLDGKEASLEELRGGEGILLDFGSIYCSGCQEFLRFLEGKRKDLAGKGVRVAAVNLDPARLHKAVKAALSGAGVSYPVVLDPDEAVAKMYGVTEVPFLVHVGPDGKVLGTHEGLPGNEPEGTDPFPSIPGLLVTPKGR